MLDLLTRRRVLSNYNDGNVYELYQLVTLISKHVKATLA